MSHAAAPGPGADTKQKETVRDTGGTTETDGGDGKWKK